MDTDFAGIRLEKVEMSASIRVNVVHSQALMAAGLLSLLQNEADIKPVLSDACGEQCYDGCMKLEPDVLLLELNVNHDRGLYCIRQITARFPDARILVLSALSDAFRASHALDAGAKGFITYQTPPDQLAFAIREVARGGVYIEPRIAGKMKQIRTSGKSSLIAMLSEREYQILLLILEGRNTMEISKSLHVSNKTISNHHTHIMHKLSVSNPVELTRLAIREGIIKA